MRNSGEENIQVKECFCIFVDILGFSKKKENHYEKGTSNEHLKKLVKSIKESKDSLKTSNLLMHKVFSDNIFISIEAEEDDDNEWINGHLLEELNTYQISMIKNGFFIRGGWVRNTSYMNEDLIYGMGIIESYKLENKAEFPIIELSSKVIDDFLKCSEFHSASDEPQQFKRLLRQLPQKTEDKNKVFVNYLSNNDYEKTLYEHHKKIVEEKLKEFEEDENVRPKYEWLADYHNFMVRNLEYFHSEWFEVLSVSQIEDLKESLTITGAIEKYNFDFFQIR